MRELTCSVHATEPPQINLLSRALVSKRPRAQAHKNTTARTVVGVAPRRGGLWTHPKEHANIEAGRELNNARHAQ